MAHYIFVVNVRTEDEYDPGPTFIRDELQSTLEWLDGFEKATVRQVFSPGGFDEAAKGD